MERKGWFGLTILEVSVHNLWAFSEVIYHGGNTQQNKAAHSSPRSRRERKEGTRALQTPFFFETGSYYVVQAGLKPPILLLQPP
jgi:hypothetical protein